jgi:P4 family phage/plasmid primase-like protien
MMEIVKKILNEGRLRDKKKDHSVLDEIDDENKFKKEDLQEAIQLISNYQNKVDLAEKFLEIIPLYYDFSGLWWRWCKNRWVLTDEVDILNLVQGSSGANIITSKERTEIVNALKQEARRRKPKLPEKRWLQFNDEILNLDTGERFKVTPKYFVTNPIPYDLGVNEETPVMDRIFEEWVGKKYVRTLYEIISYCLLPDYPMNRLFCFIGSGMNGKSKFLELLRKFIGDENVCSTELDALISSRFEITRLHKKLICQMGETNFNEMSKTSIIKKLTGGDLIGFEYKNKNPFEEINYAKIIIATNNLPTTTDKTLGFYRRWLIIDFPNQFSERKNILEEIPEEEYKNLAMKCVGLLIDLLKNREFYNEGTIEERMAKYEAKSDFLQKFLDEFTEEKIDCYISKADFRKKFASWCKENRHREMADNTLSKNLKKKGIEAGRKYMEWLFDGKGGQLTVYLDIKWKD